MGCLKIFIAVGLLFAGQLGAVELSVYRQLPFRIPEVPNDVLASDPIIGRLACPPMVQYNLLSKSFSSQLFTDIAFSVENKSWSLTVGPGVRWWSGEEVNNVAVANYLEKYLKKILQTEYRYEDPKFTVKPKSKNQVSLKFFSKEFYGPYLLSGHPMVRKKGRGYECTGDFSYQAKDHAAIALKKRPHASGYRYDEITLSPSVDVSLAADGHWLRARQQVPNIHGPRCERTIDYSIFTQIVWNTTLKPTDSIQVRRLLDRALPRTHLINHVMHGQANLVTGPWIRVHPGYDDRLNFTPIDSRLIKEKVRNNSVLKHSEINICSDDRSPFIENLLLSAFESYGLKVKFKRAAHRHSQKCHGYLEVFDSIWPEYKHIYTWLSRPEWGSSKKDLQEIGIKYLKTMSYGQPNFSYLKQIHERLFRRSLVSVLMQHKACIDVGKGFKRQLPPLIMRDLSWFEKLLKN